MQDALRLLPDIQILFSNAEQNRDVLLFDNMSFFECRAFELSGQDLCYVMAQNMSGSFRGFDVLHAWFLSYWQIVCRQPVPDDEVPERRLIPFGLIFPSSAFGHMRDEFL